MQKHFGSISAPPESAETEMFLLSVDDYFLLTYVIYALPLSNSLVPLSEVPAELPGYNKGGDIKGGIPDTTFIPPSIPPLYIPKRAAMVRVKCIMSMTEYRYRSSLLRNSRSGHTYMTSTVKFWTPS